MHRIYRLLNILYFEETIHQDYQKFAKIESVSLHSTWLLSRISRVENV